MDFVEARKLFPGLNNKVFLDAACVSLIPITAKKEIHKFLDMALECPSRDASLHHIEMDIWRRNICVEAAKLFNVHIDRVALIESTTQGLNIAVNSIPYTI
jgi:cysteine desulfurase/selenocysteine lyase